MAKILLSQIQEEADNIQWKLVSTEYKNLQSELNWICPKGHTVISSYGQWRKTHECPICNLEVTLTANNTIVPKKKNSFRILALDQATYTTGWAIFEDGELIRHGVYSVQGDSEAKRIDDVKKWVWNVITVWKIDYVQLEDIQLQDHQEAGVRGQEIGITTYKTLAHLQGVLENLCFSNSISYSVVFPATWRKYNEIKGKNKTDKKKNAQLKVRSLYGVNVPLDEAEAICIGRYAVANRGKNMQIVSWE